MFENSTESLYPRACLSSDWRSVFRPLLYTTEENDTHSNAPVGYIKIRR